MCLGDWLIDNKFKRVLVRVNTTPIPHCTIRSASKYTHAATHTNTNGTKIRNMRIEQQTAMQFSSPSSMISCTVCMWNWLCWYFAFGFLHNSLIVCRFIYFTVEVRMQQQQPQHVQSNRTKWLLIVTMKYALQFLVQFIEFEIDMCLLSLNNSDENHANSVNEATNEPLKGRKRIISIHIGINRRRKKTKNTLSHSIFHII